MRKTVFILVGLIVSAGLLCSMLGCSTVSYYSQSARGHLALLAKARPIDTLLQDDDTSVQRQRQLDEARAIRDFASASLALPDNGSYRHFVELGRPFVVWNVVAAPALSLEPIRWCYPLIGCVSYRGYFDREEAEAFADSLRRQGNDVMVRGVRAYSTLGWFDDPLLSSMLDQGSIATAEVIFHELAHQVVYVAGDAEFNEAFASAVGELGVQRWLAERHPGKLDRYRQALGRRDRFLALLRDTADELRRLYAGPQPEADKRREKARILARLRRRYDTLKASWNGYNGYDGWFDQPVNNARFASLAVYRDRVPDFERWFAACGKDFARFYRAVRRLGEMPRPRRHATLQGAADCRVDQTRLASER